VIAIDLAGDEAYPAAPFAEVLRAARVGDTELASLARASVEAAFAPAELKAQISAAIGQWLQS
jgi:adenosine deaminase